MKIEFGVDTLCYHTRILAGKITVEEAIRQCSSLGISFVQITGGHLRGWTPSRLADLRKLAGDLGIKLAYFGGFIGLAGNGDTPETGAGRIVEAVKVASTLGSPYVSTSSGFYRAELWKEPNRIRQELEFVTEALRLAEKRAEGNVSILLENHSDFTPDEYVQIIKGVESTRVSVFLDLVNSVSVLADPMETAQRLAPLAPAGHIKDFRMVSRYAENAGRLRRGFEVQWCYPGEGLVDLPGLLNVVSSQPREASFWLSIEGLDNYPDIDDQRERLSKSLALMVQYLEPSVPA